MEYPICINKNSFPAPTISEGKLLFDDALQGVLALNSGDDRFVFYLDSNKESLFDFSIAQDLTVQLFIDGHDDPDIELFLYEAEDKSPALDHLSDEIVENISQHTFYIPGEAYCDYPDVYSLTWELSGIMLSISTAEVWSNNFIDISMAASDGRFLSSDDIGVRLRNISSQSSGKFHFRELCANEPIEKLIEPHLISEECKAWFLELTEENKNKILDKLRLAKYREFAGGEPLFKSLDNGDGIREIRLNAFSGGAIRILFKHLLDKKYVLLYGFIKKTNTEGYVEALRQAKDIYSDLKFLTPMPTV